MSSDLDQLHPKARRLADRHLEADEAVITVVPGRSKQAMIVTERRLLVVKPGLLAGMWLGGKAAGFPFATVTTIHAHAGRGFLALELVLADRPRRGKPDLVSAYQLPNWLPCHSSLTGSAVIDDLRVYVQSDGRSQSARAELGAFQPPA